MNNLQTTNDLQTTKGMNLCMTNSRRKGKVGELEVVRLCKAEGYDVHRSAQFCGNNESGAADVVGLPGIHIEVKRVEHLNLDDACPSPSYQGCRQDYWEHPGCVPPEKRYRLEGDYGRPRLV